MAATGLAVDDMFVHLLTDLTKAAFITDAPENIIYRTMNTEYIYVLYIMHRQLTGVLS